jgi:hypothetical protein
MAGCSPGRVKYYLPVSMKIRGSPAVSRQNISQTAIKTHRSISWLSAFEDWTENPRVGGSIPPLATIQISILR